MAKSSFQEIILKLQDFWASHGCLITQPYYTQVGAGTMNPNTFLRVLGPEPWNVAYIEPSVRPDDGRYGENPNRFQVHYQYQVILKPDPGNPQELYLESLKALGIDPREHDIRFVEDNWEQPAVSAWGLGWEVWLDGQEITQFTYFQQMGGVALDPVSVEITYGLERILIALNNAKAIWAEDWGAGVSYGEIRKEEEFEHSKYYFETADVARVRKMYDLFSAEAEASLAAGLIVPAHDYVLKCSHAFNILDTRGAISVAERQAFFKRMRELARQVAEAYAAQRKQLEYPLLKEQTPKAAVQRPLPESVSGPADFVLEIGTEELPAEDIDSALSQLRGQVPSWLDGLHLKHAGIRIQATPRRLVIFVDSLAPNQPDRQDLVKGPPADKAFDKEGTALPAALGFAKKNGLDVKELQVREDAHAGGRYVFAVVKQKGRSALEVLSEALPKWAEGIKFEKTMRWNESGVIFARPIRWLVALHGQAVIPFEYAGVTSGNLTRGLRPYDSPEIEIKSADQYFDIIRAAGVVLDSEERKTSILEQVGRTSGFVGGDAVGASQDSPLINEVTNLVEKPTAVLGNFNAEFLQLPREVLISTMEKHQRFFPIEKNGRLLPNFIAIRNGDDQHLDLVQQGNEHVLSARFADADFFVHEDLKHKLEEFRPKLAGLIFHAKLGSMLDKSARIEKLTRGLVRMLALDEEQAADALRAAHLSKADLVTQMVTEMTSLQGIIGREYAVRSGEKQEVALAIGEQYQTVPRTKTGLAVALADRLDSLVGLFSTGLVPTGAKDPFGLRRAALGIVQPLIEHDIEFDLDKAVRKAAKLQPIEVKENLPAQVLDFITGRLKVVLNGAGYKYDVVDAVLAWQSNNPAGAARAVKELQAWVARPDWNTILPAFARCVRITRDQRKTFKVYKKYFAEKQEQALFKALQTAEAASRGEGSVDDFLNAFVPMIPAVDTFFDKVLVMADDKALRQNRLGLLQRISALSNGVADLSKLEGF
jgi:glycyl-tRNA synthetase